MSLRHVQLRDFILVEALELDFADGFTALARGLGLEVRSPFEADAEPGHIADWLVALPDEIVMVCWEHSSLPGIARAVGERASVANATDIPGVWPDDRFDLIWRFDLDSGATARFSIAAQQLLWGDAPA